MSDVARAAGVSVSTVSHVVNGTPPPYAWAIGGTRRTQEWPNPTVG